MVQLISYIISLTLLYITQVSHSLNFFVVKELSSYRFARPFGQ